MSARKWIVTCAILGASGAAFGSNGDGIILSHYEPLERLSVQVEGAEFTANVNLLRRRVGEDRSL